MFFKEYKPMHCDLNTPNYPKEVKAGDGLVLTLDDKENKISVVIAKVHQNSYNQQLQGYFLDGTNWYAATILLKKDAWEGKSSLLLVPTETPRMEQPEVIKYYEEMLRTLPLVKNNYA